jgi:DNA-binding GntR family transcriptional regulator
MQTPQPDGLGVLDHDAPTLTARAAEALRRAIHDGRLAGGDLYSVARLAAQLGVSRTPVREALLLLERQGMVRFERNRGVRILETSAHDLEEVFTLRLLLELPATARACALIDEADLEALERELEVMRGMAAEDDERTFMVHDQRFHEIIHRASGNRRLAELVGQLREQVRFRGASTVGRSRSLEAIYDEHLAILEALRARDPERAADAMRVHIHNTARLLTSQEGGSDAWSLQGWGL